jgi:hypothetical protein
MAHPRIENLVCSIYKPPRIDTYYTGVNWTRKEFDGTVAAFHWSLRQPEVGQKSSRNNHSFTLIGNLEKRSFFD